MTFGKTTPILRMFDEAKAREFYLDFLGFTLAGSTDSNRAPLCICRSQGISACYICPSTMAMVIPAPRCE
jgi:hypothetical protein